MNAQVLRLEHSAETQLTWIKFSLTLQSDRRTFFPHSPSLHLPPFGFPPGIRLICARSLRLYLHGNLLLKQMNYAKSVAGLPEFQAAVRRDDVFVPLAASDFRLQTSLAADCWRPRDCVSLTAEQLRVFSSRRSFVVVVGFFFFSRGCCSFRCDETGALCCRLLRPLRPLMAAPAVVFNPFHLPNPLWF